MNPVSLTAGRYSNRNPLNRVALPQGRGRSTSRTQGGENEYEFILNNCIVSVDLLGLSALEKISILFVGAGPSSASYRRADTLWASIFLTRNPPSDCACLVSRLEYSGKGSAAGEFNDPYVEYFFHGNQKQSQIDLINLHLYHEEWDATNGGEPTMFIPIQSGDPETRIKVNLHYKIFKPCPQNAQDSFKPKKGNEPLHHRQSSLWDLNEASFPWSATEPQFWSNSENLLQEGNYSLDLRGNANNKNKSGWEYTDKPLVKASGQDVGHSGTPGGIPRQIIPRVDKM
jgi:hypothetical protein